MITKFNKYFNLSEASYYNNDMVDLMTFYEKIKNNKNIRIVSYVCYYDDHFDSPTSSIHFETGDCTIYYMNKKRENYASEEYIFHIWINVDGGTLFSTYSHDKNYGELMLKIFGKIINEKEIIRICTEKDDVVFDPIYVEKFKHIIKAKDFGMFEGSLNETTNWDNFDDITIDDKTKTNMDEAAYNIKGMINNIDKINIIDYKVWDNVSLELVFNYNKRYYLIYSNIDTNNYHIGKLTPQGDEYYCSSHSVIYKGSKDLSNLCNLLRMKFLESIANGNFNFDFNFCKDVFKENELKKYNWLIKSSEFDLLESKSTSIDEECNNACNLILKDLKKSKITFKKYNSQLLEIEICISEKTEYLISIYNSSNIYNSHISYNLIKYKITAGPRRIIVQNFKAKSSDNSFIKTTLEKLINKLVCEDFIIEALKNNNGLEFLKSILNKEKLKEYDYLISALDFGLIERRMYD